MEKTKVNAQAWKNSAKDILAAGCNLDRKIPRQETSHTYRRPACHILDKERG
jgi:hypothetical protein